MRPHLKALERGIRRQDIELRNQLIRGADAVRAVGRQHGGRQRESVLDRRSRRLQGFHAHLWDQLPDGSLHGPPEDDG